MRSHADCRAKKMYECPYNCSAVTAEALKIITAPNKHSASVTPKSQRSLSGRLGTLVHRPPEMVLVAWRSS